jgi:hypothetical protein
MVDAPPGQFAFTYLTSTGKLESFTHMAFVARLKAELVASGYDASRYAVARSGSGQVSGQVGLQALARQTQP